MRSYTRLELRWDAWAYHVPFAAKAAGIHVPFELTQRLQDFYDGYPALPHLLMGLVWRATNDINTIGVLNIAAFGGFLAVCQFKLHAPFYVIAPIALTAPMVIIHTATSYVDLFSNSLLATGLCTIVFVYLHDRRHDRRLFFIGAGALVGALWSKPQLGLICMIGFGLYALVYRPWTAPVADRTRRVAEFGALVVIGLGNYIKNFLVFGNPFWPVEFPVLGNVFPATWRYSDVGVGDQRPPSLAHANQVVVFFRSLFEIGVPTHYPDRARWIIDQGHTAAGYRMGGFWNVNVVVYLVLFVGLLVVVHGRRGRVVALTGLALLVIVSAQPNSNDMRYLQFLPLTWAGVVGIVYPSLKRHRPEAAIGLLAVVAVLFAVMTSANAQYYRIERVDYAEAARQWNVASMWRYLRPGYTYCVVGAAPAGVFYTGPTQSEFRVVTADFAPGCPPGAVRVENRIVHYEART